jgi:hypothetical protein
MRTARWLFTGYDFPLQRDWLAWLGLAITVAAVWVQVSRHGPWSLVGAPLVFALVGWIGGALRNLARGYRNPTQDPPLPGYETDTD